MATAEQWLGKLAPLKVDKARGDPAPHKPLLVLVVLELAEQGSFVQKRCLEPYLLCKNVESAQAQGSRHLFCALALTPELAFRFCTYLVPSRVRVIGRGQADAAISIGEVLSEVLTIQRLDACAAQSFATQGQQQVEPDSVQLPQVHDCFRQAQVRAPG